MDYELFEDPKIVGAFSTLRDPPLPPGAWARLQTALAGRASNLWRWSAAGAVAAAAVVVSIFTLQGEAGPRLIEVRVRDVASGPGLDEWSAYVGHFADEGGVPVAPPDLTRLPPEMDRP